MKKQPDGIIKLLFSNVAGRTIAKRVFHEGNSRVSSNVNLLTEETPCYYLISTGGGFIEGEHYEVEIDVEPGAHAIVRNQTSTYVYKCENGKKTTQHTKVKIKEGFLEFFTNEVIPYQHAIYEQNTVFEMDQNSTLVYSDGITSGWALDESRFSFNDVRQLTKIFMDGKLIYNDCLLLRPEDQPVTELGYFEGKTNYNTLIIIDPAVDDAFIHELREELGKKHSSLYYGLSALSVNGFVLRVLSDSAHDSQYLLYDAINYFRAQHYQLPELKNHR